MSLASFKSSINNKGIIKTNRYEARFSFSDRHYLAKSSYIDQRLLSIRCDSATLPGITLASADGPPRLGYGPVERRPYVPLFDDLTLTFMVDAGSQVHKILYEWINCIVNTEGRGARTLGTARPNTNAVAYEVGYRDNYDSILELLVFKDSGVSTMTFTAYNVFPMAFPQVAMNWNEGDILRLPIPFAYTDFTVDYARFNTGGPVETGRDEEAFDRTMEKVFGEIERGPPTPTTPSNVIVNPNSRQQRFTGA
jgi:hypothetical protein